MFLITIKTEEKFHFFLSFALFSSFFRQLLSVSRSTFAADLGLPWILLVKLVVLAELVDQMIQAARSGKQNIVEGCEDGMTSTEMEIKLINVARSSLQELREDYEDYLHTRHLPLWNVMHPRYDRMLAFCREHNSYEHYEAYVTSLSDEDLANLSITLCRFTDKMITTYLQYLERRFVTEGGIKERMHAARTGYRQQQDQRMQSMQRELEQLRQALQQKDAEIQRLRKIIGLS